MRNLFFCSLIPSVFFLCGCGGDGRQAVSGTVTFKGKPLDQGTIEFRPTAQEVNSFAGAEIKDGSYSIPASKGLLAGDYKVSISSPEGGGVTQQMPGESDKIPKERIPAEFNINTKLTCTIKAGEAKTFDIKIPGK